MERSLLMMLEFHAILVACLVVSLCAYLVTRYLFKAKSNVAFWVSILVLGICLVIWRYFISGSWI